MIITNHVLAGALIGLPSRSAPVAAGILGACLPDTDQVSVHFLGTHVHPAWFNDLHYTIQREHERLGKELLLAAGLAAAVALATRRARRRSATLVFGV